MSKIKFLDPLVNMVYDSVDNDNIVIHKSNRMTYVSDPATILAWLKCILNDDKKLEQINNPVAFYYRSTPNGQKQRFGLACGTTAEELIMFELYRLCVPITRLVPKSTQKKKELCAFELPIGSAIYDWKEQMIKKNMDLTIIAEIQKVMRDIFRKILIENGYAYYCPNENCSNHCEGEMFHFKLGKPKKYYKNRLIITCNLCKTSMCYGCGASPDHPGLTCQEHKKLEHERSNILTSGLGYKNCPKCNNIVEKSDGCDHMVCSSVGSIKGCGADFCYRCGDHLVTDIYSHLQLDYYDNVLKCKKFVIKPFANVDDD